MQSCLFLPLTDPLCTRYMEFVCKNRAQCLFQSLVCDGIKHCEDGSDEDGEYAGCGKKHQMITQKNTYQLNFGFLKPICLSFSSVSQSDPAEVKF